MERHVTPFEEGEGAKDFLSKMYFCMIKLFLKFPDYLHMGTSESQYSEFGDFAIKS